MVVVADVVVSGVLLWVVVIEVDVIQVAVGVLVCWVVVEAILLGFTGIIEALVTFVVF